ncbi:MAG: hypothetical protein GXY07_07235 [Candidatus Hydrogenedentes bacterium]|nr:hypothetical protein [Candidatus Hydrogenedentota bacterium]
MLLTRLISKASENKGGARIVVLLILIVLAVPAWFWWQIYGIGGWRDQVYGLAGLYGARQALNDFKQGHLRLYRLGGQLDKPQFTGETERNFEIWNPQFYPDMSRAHRYATEVFIESYNRKMEYIRSHQEDFPINDPVVLPENAGNGNLLAPTESG